MNKPIKKVIIQFNSQWETSVVYECDYVGVVNGGVLQLGWDDGKDSYRSKNFPLVNILHYDIENSVQVTEG